MYMIPASEFSNNILRLEDGTEIPPTADNKDYREYLKWLAEGNEPIINTK